MELLDDKSTWINFSTNHYWKYRCNFISPIKKSIRKEDKFWSSLIDYYLIIPEIYDLPKTHKPAISLWPIILGIEISLYNISKSLAKMLSPLLGMINDLHIKNSSDLLNKINNINRENKYLVSLNIKSFYANIPVYTPIFLFKNVLNT